MFEFFRLYRLHGALKKNGVKSQWEPGIGMVMLVRSGDFSRDFETVKSYMERAGAEKVGEENGLPKYCLGRNMPDHDAIEKMTEIQTKMLFISIKGVSAQYDGNRYEFSNEFGTFYVELQE